MAKPKHAPKSTLSDFAKCREFLERMCHHLAYTPDAGFRPRAYEAALAALSEHGSLEGLGAVKGIGKSMQAAFAEVVTNKDPKCLLEIESNGPPFSTRELTRVPGVGPKRAEKLYNEHKIASLAELGAAIRSHKITDAKLVQAFYEMGAVTNRVSRETVVHAIEPWREIVNNIIGVECFEVCGSLRRHRADIRDIDFVLGVDTDKRHAVLQALIKHTGVKPNVSGDAKAEFSIVINSVPRKLDVNFVKPKHWGTALLHFTGSKSYNKWCREAALKQGLSLNQYGIVNTKTEKRRVFVNEAGALQALGLPWVPPECRDFPELWNRDNSDLLELDSVFADFHVHTKESDGLATTHDVLKTVMASKRLKVIGFSNHSQSSGSGMTGAQALDFREALIAETDMIRYRVGSEDRRAQVLVGAEVDITKTGELDYGDQALRGLDYVVLSVHRYMDSGAGERMITAIRRCYNIGVPAILAHPTTRVIGHRPGLDIDFGPVLRACADTRTGVEINGQPDRVDATDEVIRQARRMGCCFAISSDLHGKPSGIHRNQLIATMQARRNGVTARECINANPELFKQWIQGGKG